MTVFVQSNHILSIQLVRFELDALPNATPPPSRTVCGALGRILLLLFSKGRSKQSNPSRESACSQDSSISNENNAFDAYMDVDTDIDCGNISPGVIRNWDAMRMSPLEDVMADATSSGSISARRLLLDSGMPLSVRRLVCDLLAADDPSNGDILVNSVPIKTPEEAIADLTSMKSHPQGHFYDQTCPQTAMDETSFFHDTEGMHLLYGAETCDSLMKAKDKIASHVRFVGDDQEDTSSSQDPSFLCQTVLVSGNGAGGASLLSRSLLQSCDQEGWFVINCVLRLDDQSAPQAMAKALDDFINRWLLHIGDASSETFDLNPLKSFRQVCESLIQQLLVPFLFGYFGQ